MPFIPACSRQTSSVYEVLFKKLKKNNPSHDKKSSTKLTCLSWNVRSANNKIENIMDYLIDNDVTLAFIQETWLKEQNNHTTAIIKAKGYNLSHVCRLGGTGGGVAIIYK